jgi:hypothetical protein
MSGGEPLPEFGERFAFLEVEGGDFNVGDEEEALFVSASSRGPRRRFDLRYVSEVGCCLKVLFGGFCMILAFLLVFNATSDDIHQEKKSTISLDSICETSACVSAASSLLSQLDQSIDPCEDFYSFTCSKWDLTNPIPESRSSISVLSKLGDEHEAMLRRIFV